MKKNQWGVGPQCYVANAATVGAGLNTYGPIVINCIDSIGVQLVTTGTVAGTWTIEVSNDYIAVPALEGGIPAQNPGTWSAYTGLGTPAAVSSGGSNQYLERNGIAARAMRFKFTQTSGTGTASVIVYGKGQG